MGIKGLHGIIKPFIKTVHISQFADSVVAVDLFCYLWQSAYSNGQTEIQPSAKFLNYFDVLFDLLKKYNIKCILVLDGRKVKAKAETHALRKIARNGKGKESIGLVDVSQSCIHRLRQTAKERGIDTINAPYEADAQIGWIFQNGICDFVLSEDADLIVYGCEKVSLRSLARNVS